MAEFTGKQSRLESLLESLFQVGSGYFISLGLWFFVVTPCWHLNTSAGDMFGINALFTVTSICRTFIWRRFFNAGAHRFIHQFVVTWRSK